MRTNLINVVKFILIQQTFSIYYMKKIVLAKLWNAKMSEIQFLSFKNIKSKGEKRYKYKC